MAFLQIKTGKSGPIYYIVDKSCTPVRWTRLGGNRDGVTAAVAKRALARYQLDANYLRLHEPLVGPAVTMAECVDEYVRWAAAHKSAKTLRNERHLLQHVATALGRRPLASVTCSELEQQLHGYAPNSVRLYVVALRQLYTYAVRQHYVPTNIARELRVPTIPQYPPRFIEIEALRAIVRAMAGQSQRIAWTMLYTGVRPAEAMRLQVRDVDFTHGQLTIRYSKTGRFRRIPLDCRW